MLILKGQSIEGSVGWILTLQGLPVTVLVLGGQSIDGHLGKDL